MAGLSTTSIPADELLQCAERGACLGQAPDHRPLDFAERYGFLRRSGYIRFRVAGGFCGFSELSVRAKEFTAAPDGITHPYVIENDQPAHADPAFDVVLRRQAAIGDDVATKLARAAWPRPIGVTVDPNPARAVSVTGLRVHIIRTSQ
jgi:hypothetical protein